MKFDEERSFSSLEEVTRLLVDIEGKTFREIDRTGRGAQAGNKGSLGNIIEESVLGYAINSDNAPDIIAGGEHYELKVTPLRHTGTGTNLRTVAKERLVVDVINYMNLPKEDFEHSKFWDKARQMIIVYYYDDRKDKKAESRLDCKILESFVLRYRPDELQTIRKDWELIHQKVSAGHANELSESDTNYLAACTKGSTAAKSWRDAPAPLGSSTLTIKAKQRAFSYKSSYMTTIANRVLNGDNNMQRLYLSSQDTLNSYVQNKIGLYKGQTIKALADKFNLVVSSHYSFNSHLALRMLGTTSHNPQDIEQFASANITQVKTSVIYDNNLPEQNMSFPALKQNDWKELANPYIDWRDSSLYQFFEENKFCIIVFRAQGKNRKTTDKQNDILLGGFLWNMPEKDIEQYVKPVWQRVHDLMIHHESVHYYEEKANRLPGMSFNHVFHMRPHGRDGKDTITLPNGETITKQCWWLDRQYIAKIIAENICI